jgi:hypothetical protein
VARALPISVLAGQLSAAAAATEHTCCELLTSSASDSGSVTLLEWKFDCPAPWVTLATSVGCRPTPVRRRPRSASVSLGAKRSALQAIAGTGVPLVAWACWPVVDSSVTVEICPAGTHPVGLVSSTVPRGALGPEAGGAHGVPTCTWASPAGWRQALG